MGVKGIIRENKPAYKRDDVGRICKEHPLFHAKERNVKMSTIIGIMRKQTRHILKTLREKRFR